MSQNNINVAPCSWTSGIVFSNQALFGGGRVNESIASCRSQNSAFDSAECWRVFCQLETDEYFHHVPYIDMFAAILTVWVAPAVHWSTKMLVFLYFSWVVTCCEVWIQTKSRSQTKVTLLGAIFNQTEAAFWFMPLIATQVLYKLVQCERWSYLWIVQNCSC